MTYRDLAFVLSIFATAPALAAEFTDHCANGLANYEMLVPTDCSVNWVDENTGKTYCFSSEHSMEEFLEDTETNLARAAANFAKLKDE